MPPVRMLKIGQFISVGFVSIRRNFFKDKLLNASYLKLQRSFYTVIYLYDFDFFQVTCPLRRLINARLVNHNISNFSQKCFDGQT